MSRKIKLVGASNLRMFRQMPGCAFQVFYAKDSKDEPNIYEVPDDVAEKYVSGGDFVYADMPEAADKSKIVIEDKPILRLKDGTDIKGSDS